MAWRGGRKGPKKGSKISDSVVKVFAGKKKIQIHV